LEKTPVITYLQQQFVQHGLTTQNKGISVLQRHRWMIQTLGQGHAGHATCYSDQHPSHCNRQAFNKQLTLNNCPDTAD